MGNAHMNKSELIDAVAESTGLSKADSTRALDSVLGAITDSLKKGDQVSLVGFGSFLVRKRSARTGRNPQTGERIMELREVIGNRPLLYNNTIRNAQD